MQNKCQFVKHKAKHIDTLQIQYNALQYNVNSVITRLQSWLPIFLGPTSSHSMNSWLWCDVRSKTCRPVAPPTHSDGTAAAVGSTLYMYVQHSSQWEGEGWVM